MSDLSELTPAEQVRALGLAVGDTIEGRWERGEKWIEYRRKLVGHINGHPAWLGSEIGSEFDGRCASQLEYTLPSLVTDWRKISSDPTLDPAEPLRRELREANGIIKGLIDIYERRTGGYLPRTYEAPALAWLARNAAFGAGKGEQ